MTFTRTKSGLKNYSRFFNVDITVFAEGKNCLAEQNKKFGTSVETSDELFHHTILNIFSPNHLYKIKSVGSKTNVDTYAKKIRDGDIRNCLLIYDSDYESVITSWVAPAWAMRTYGYSWENDFWTAKICESVIDILSGGRTWNKSAFHQTFLLAEKRITDLSRVEVFCRVNGINLIIPKNKSLGVRISSGCAALISASEAKRLIEVVKSQLRSVDDALRLEIRSLLRPLISTQLVRGHLWEAICISLIVRTLKKIQIDSALPTDLIRNVALGLFKENPLHYLEKTAQTHYSKQQKQAGL